MFMISLIAGIVGFVFTFIGTVTPAWFTYTGVNGGLFTLCSAGNCASYEIGNVLNGGGFIKGIVCLGFVCALAGMIVALVYYFKYLKNSLPNNNLVLAVGILYLVSGVCVLLGSIVFGAKMEAPYSVGYSFGLAIVGSILCLVAGPLSIVHRSKQVAAQ